MSDIEGKTVTFFSKNPIICPVCDTKFYREDLLSGRGRLIAGNLTSELRRKYEPNKKYGDLFPLIYPVTVCPSCYYAAYHKDFLEAGEAVISQVKRKTEQRHQGISLIFDNLDFTDYRSLKEGVASYYLAVMSYDFFDKDFIPTFKRGLSTLRTAWLFNDLHSRYPSENYDYLARLFYRKARFFYNLAVERDQNNEEPLPGTTNFGPDIDKNYGYDGFIYLAALFELRFGPKEDKEKRINSLTDSKKLASHLFGTGKASRDKPIDLLNYSRTLFKDINEELSLLQPAE